MGKIKKIDNERASFVYPKLRKSAFHFAPLPFIRPQRPSRESLISKTNQSAFATAPVYVWQRRDVLAILLSPPFVISIHRLR